MNLVEAGINVPQFFHTCMQHTARAFLNHEEYSISGKIWSWWHVWYSGCLKRQEEQDLRSLVDETVFLVKSWGISDKFSFILKKKKASTWSFNMSMFCTEKGVSKNSFPLIFNKEDNRAFKERWVTRLAQGVHQAGHERQKFFLKINTWIF